MRHSDSDLELQRDESRKLDTGFLIAGGCVVLVLIALGVGGLFLIKDVLRSDEPLAAEDGDDEGEDGPQDAPETTVIYPGSTTPDVPAAGLAQRYRPGPHVEVVGVLPTGLGSSRRLSDAVRSGHTLNTPWVVVGAELRPEAAPPASPSGAPRVDWVDHQAQLVVIPGSPAPLPIRADPGAGPGGEIHSLLVDFPGYEGHFVLPAVVDSELGQFRIAGVDDALVQFGLDSPLLPSGQPSTSEMPATIRIAAIDLEGRISPWIQQRLSVMPLGTGDVEVTLTMSEATDLDLYVIEPGGTTIYYGNTRSFTGGQLDLDANAGCGGNMGVNNEHIYWPAGRAPQGTYEVRVSNYRSCISGREVSYTITVNNCGETTVYRGSFVGNGDGQTCSGAAFTESINGCQRVVSFDLQRCRR